MASDQQNRKSTIYDIATATGTSPATVSIVLNGHWERHRIRRETAERVMEAARAVGYNVNLRARALRLARSGLAGMIIPHYRNRFFGGLSETFEAGARARGLVPIVVSTQREPETEREVVETLLAHQVEFLFITGATQPEPLNELCRRAGVPAVDLDLPGRNAPSIVTDNRAGARMLTDHLIGRLAAFGSPPQELHFLGGVADEYATGERLVGFVDGLRGHGATAAEEQILRCGYWPSAAYGAVQDLHRRRGGLPPGLFVNSITAFEGVVQFLQTLPAKAYRDFAIGCFDWNPFAAFLPFPVAMVRQDVEAMVEAAFDHLEDYQADQAPLLKIAPQFVIAETGRTDPEERPSP